MNIYRKKRKKCTKKLIPVKEIELIYKIKFVLKLDYTYHYMSP